MREINRQRNLTTPSCTIDETLIETSIAHTAVRRHCTEIYYIKIELDLRKFSNGPFSETEKGFWVIPMPGGSQCTGVSTTLS